MKILNTIRPSLIETSIIGSSCRDQLFRKLNDSLRNGLYNRIFNQGSITSGVICTSTEVMIEESIGVCKFSIRKKIHEDA